MSAKVTLSYMLILPPEIINLIAGTYSVMISDESGCQLLQSFTVEQPSKLDNLA